jgi:membrane associated rhomboid family serine protease
MGRTAMIPLGDSEAARRLSPVNTILIAANLAIFGLELWDRGAPLAYFGLVPARISHLQLTEPVAASMAVLTVVSSLFLHAGVLHVAGNMLYLLVFGPAVEARLGHARFAAFYFAAGIIACLAMVAMAPQSRVPVIGASGAIAGILGGYLVLYPGGRISTVLPSSFMLRRVEVPAIVYLLMWFGLQLYLGISSGPNGPLAGGVAWWAHVGGFLFGVAAAPLMAHKPVKQRKASAKARPRRKRQSGGQKSGRA